MTDWTRHADIRKRLEKKWDRGEFLAQSVSPVPFVSLRIPLKHPTASQLTHRFDEARTWIDRIIGKDRQGFAIEWREFNHRILGKNKLPVALVFNTLEDLLSYLGKTGEAKLYTLLFHEITGQFPELTSLLTEKPLDVLSHQDVWPELLAIVACLKGHPRPMIYLRQLEIPGVDTKFIETRKAWIDKLLTAVLPEAAVDQTTKSPAAFEKRFGFRAKPVRIRFRLLDPADHILGLSDLEIPVTDFYSLTAQPETVFIVENEVNGLAFPPFPNALVIFGLGYGLSILSDARWMHDKNLWYWGDIDTHGFAMLDQIRHHFPRTRSFLMDMATLLSHRGLWGTEPSPTSRNLPLLTADEAAVYDALRHHTHAHALRLEQERLSFSHVKQGVQRIHDRIGPISPD